MKISLDHIYIPTGNEQISIPTLYTDGSIENFNFISMKHRGLIEVVGDKEKPLMKPHLKIKGKDFKGEWQWERNSYWIPNFVAKDEVVELKGEVCAPTGERGFYYRLEVTNNSDEAQQLELGLEGCWKKTLHTINESKEVKATPSVFESGWNHLIIFELLGETPLFSFAPMVDAELDTINWNQDANNQVTYQLSKGYNIQPKETVSLCFYWGVGLEEVGAATSAKEMLRRGWQQVRGKTINWLEERIQKTGDVALDEVMNLNLFFNFFFATGQSLDTEQDVLVTSRSPRYYVSAAYWDRDSLLWSFPSILVTDSERARNMLDYVFTIQQKNIGVHSRYIDGIVLEPGFELDELCAPILALDKYLRHTEDWDYLKESHVEKSIAHILKELKKHRHHQHELYDTFLQPTDDPIVYPYISYNNMLVWKIFTILADYASRKGQTEEAENYTALADGVKTAIYQHMVVEHEGEKIFAWSVDLEGNHNVYDEPPGSLQLFPYYGFCSSEEEVYINTVKVLRSPKNHYAFAGCAFEALGCDHANHPWVLSIANSFLSGRKQQARDLVLRAPMDGGIACESIDQHTGESRTGDHFATCAGFLAYGIYHAYCKKGE